MDTLEATRTARFGTQLRNLRTARGLTQEALAARAGLSRGYTNALETGYCDDPSLSTLRALASALTVPVAALL